MLFLVFHLSMNAVAIFSDKAYDAICGFLGANWYALAGTAVIAAGVGLHFIYATYLTWLNLKARGDKRYEVQGASKGVTWASRNMFVLGLIVCGGLLIHLYNFWYNMQFVELAYSHEQIEALGLCPKEGAAKVAELFSSPVYCVIYLVWFAAIWFHLTHGVWSMFQTIGWDNKIWMPRLKCVANIVATLLMLGYAAIVVIFYIKSLCPCC